MPASPAAQDSYEIKSYGEILSATLMVDVSLMDNARLERAKIGQRYPSRSMSRIAIEKLYEISPSSSSR